MGKKILVLEENDDRDVLLTSFMEPGNSSLTGLPKSSMIDNNPSGLIIDKAAYMVYLEGMKISFPKKEFELLLLLASNPVKVFKRNLILQLIWGNEFKKSDSRSLDVHIRMIRLKLQNQFITTIRGVGYKLEKDN